MKEYAYNSELVTVSLVFFGADRFKLLCKHCWTCASRGFLLAEEVMLSLIKKGFESSEWD